MRIFLIYIRVFFLIRLFAVSVCAQTDSPYRISMEGLSSANLNLLEQMPSAVYGLDSMMMEKDREMPFSYKIKRINEAYDSYLQNEFLPVKIHLHSTPYTGKYHFDNPLDRQAFIYDTYRYSFMYEHGYFGPALFPTGGRHIPKTIYRDALYPWQNAPASKHHTYKMLYLITNFVYPDH